MFIRCVLTITQIGRKIKATRCEIALKTIDAGVRENDGYERRVLEPLGNIAVAGTPFLSYCHVKKTLSVNVL